MMLKYVGVVVAVVVLVLLMSGVARADGPYYGPWTRQQWDAVGLIYEYAEYEGLTPADTELALRIAYRETVYGYDKTGDCYAVPGGLHCSSIGIFQFHEFGVWASTPCARLGLNARWNDDDNVRCAVWAIKHGYASHWRPDIQPLGRWPAVVPSDPRYWLWGQEHYPGRDFGNAGIGVRGGLCRRVVAIYALAGLALRTGAG